MERILSGKATRKDEKELCEFTKRRIPIHWGGISDPFSCFEIEQKKSLEILRLFEKYEYPFIVSTKNKRIVEGEYWETLKRCKYKVIQVSLISLRKELEKIEPNEEIKINNRLEIIKKCAKENIRVVVRLQPFIPLFCEKGLEELIENMASLGAKAITIEYLKIPVILMPEVKRAIMELSGILGYDIETFYRKYGKKTSSDRELKTEMKKYWIIKTRKLAHKNKMEFYCADNEFRTLGDNTICCGVGNEKGFERRNEFRTSRMLDEGKEIITIDDYLKKDVDLFEKISKSKWINMGNSYTGSMRKKMSLKDLAIEVWNNPKCSLSPCKFYNNVKFIGKDKNGNAIYSRE